MALCRSVTARLILHVGSHKTGTTAIQQALFQHKDSFARDGIVYDPGHRFFGNLKASHHGLAHALARVEPADRVALRRYRDRLDRRARDARLIVISAEPFFRHVATKADGTSKADRRQAYLARVAEYFAGFDVTVSVYLRRPDKFAVSLYKEILVRTGQSRSFADFLAARGEEFNYASRLAPFRQMFPAVQVRSYEAAVPRGLVRGFFEDHHLPLSPDYIAARTRGGISATAALWLARAKSAGGVTDEDLRRRWDFLLSDLARDMLSDQSGTDLWASAEQRREFLDAALDGFDRADFWQMPTDVVRPPDWDDTRQQETEQVYGDWQRLNAARVRAREVLGAPPYQHDSSLPSARFTLLRQYFGMLGRLQGR